MSIDQANAVANQKIKKRMSEYLDTVSRCSVEELKLYYGLPANMMSVSGNAIVRTEGEKFDFLSTVFKKFENDAGVDYVWEEFVLDRPGDSVAVVSGVVERVDQAGKVCARNAVFYILINFNGEWKIIDGPPPMLQNVVLGTLGETYSWNGTRFRPARKGEISESCGFEV